GRAGADQVHVGAQVLAVLAGAVASTVGAQAEVLGRELLRRIHQLGEKIASLITDAAFLGIGVPRPPEPFPIRQALGPGRRNGGLSILMPYQGGSSGRIAVRALSPSEQLPE